MKKSILGLFSSLFLGNLFSKGSGSSSETMPALTSSDVPRTRFQPGDQFYKHLQFKRVNGKWRVRR